jgi:hypothetical protein
MTHTITRQLEPDARSVPEMPPLEASDYLRAVGEDAAADAIADWQEAADSAPDSLFGKPSVPVWMGTEHTIGFIEPGAPGSPARPITHAGNIEPDLTLRGQTIRVVLERLRVWDYPGDGTHRVLVEFNGKHQTKDGSEDLTFTQTYNVNEGSEAGVAGDPIFLGLGVGENGISISCRTINLLNEQEESLLGFMDSDVFKSGLTLLKTANPAIGPMTDLAQGVVAGVLSRNKNKKAQEMRLGLDFSNLALQPKLRSGTYIVLQLPYSDPTAQWPDKFQWADWMFYPEDGRIARHDDPNQKLRYNYVAFGITKYG